MVLMARKDARNEILTFRVSREELEVLNDKAKELGLDRSELIRLLIHLGLNDLEFLREACAYESARED